jgi:FAD/FMN-containing dehydrogenase
MAPSTSLTPVASAAVRDLRGRLRGQAFVSTDAGYDGARRIWNGAVDNSPAVIAHCVDRKDVEAAVRVAREHGLPLSVRGGGHDWGGRAVREGGLVLDLTGLRRVDVRAASAVATVQGGATAGDVAAATHPHGLAPVTGTVKAVGMTGLALAGGYGPLNGRFGLALDNIEAAGVVLADGTSVTATADENPDLLWALRGGGGNFGVVTETRFRVHPVASVLAGLLLFPLTEARTVLRGYRDLVADAPDELTVMAGFFGGPDGAPLLFLAPTWSGELSEGERYVDLLRSLGEPLDAQVDAMSFQDALGLFDATVVDGRHNEMRTRWLPALTEDTIEIIVTAAARMTSPFSGMFLHHFHGASARVGVTDTAFAMRRDHLLVEIVAAWTPSAGLAESVHTDWARGMSADLARHALPGGYANLLGADEHERALLGYGPNADRLLDLKRRFDPDGVFDAVPTLSPPRG